VKMKEIFTY